jgi:hypothetical protein
MASSSIRAVPDALIPNSFKSSTVSFVATFPLISLSRNTGSYWAEAPHPVPKVHGGALHLRFAVNFLAMRNDCGKFYSAWLIERQVVSHSLPRSNFWEDF